MNFSQRTRGIVRAIAVAMALITFYGFAIGLGVGLPAFIATLAMLSIARGLALVRAFVLGVCLRAVGLRQRPHLRRAGRIPAVEAAARQRERVFGHAANQKSTRLNPMENTVRLKL